MQYPPDMYTAGLVGGDDFKTLTYLEEVTTEALGNQSVERFIDAKDVAVFLAGPHGRTISGQMLRIDGDSKSTQ